MKAVICPTYGPPEVLQITDIPKPSPKADEVCIKINTTTVTVADSRVRAFRIPKGFWLPARLMLGLFGPRKKVLGVELSGTIDSKGSKVNNFEIGQNVFAACLFNFGAYSEYICLKAKGPILPIPKSLSIEKAAAIPVGGRTALYFLKAADVLGQELNKKVLVYGASGSVGSYAVQIAKHYGARVTAVCGPSNTEMVKSLGAHKVLNYTSPQFKDQLDMYDVIFVAIDAIDFQTCNQHLKPGGSYINIVRPFKSSEMRKALRKDNKKIFVGDNPGDGTEDLMLLSELIDGGHLKVIIDRTYSLDDIQEAHRYVDAGHKKGNVLVQVAT